jgi:outer membrane protein OmpA-like peptidoglycan-associated protein
MQNGSGATSSSMTDLLASLVAVFVLLFVAVQNNRIGDKKTARDALIRQLRGQLVTAGIDSAAVDSVPNDPATVVVVLPDSVLFERGESRMSEAGRTVVRTATPVLAGVLCADSVRVTLDQMVVEGHTDNTIPRGMGAEAGRMFNLELSQRRSMDFVSTSTASLGGTESLLECYLGLVSATGRGQENPIPNVPADSALQRRVVLRLRLNTDIRDSLRVLPAVVGGGPATNP